MFLSGFALVLLFHLTDKTLFILKQTCHNVIFSLKYNIERNAFLFFTKIKKRIFFWQNKTITELKPLPSSNLIV